jgi:hypothetical protein
MEPFNIAEVEMQATASNDGDFFHSTAITAATGWRRVI